MKQILLLTATLLIALSGCGDKGNKPNILKDVTLNIHVKNAPRSEGQTLLTPRQIVEQCGMIKFYPAGAEQTATRGWADAQRDVENNILKMWSYDVISEDQDGNIILIDVFLNARDVTFLREGPDTIAYIPNAVLRKAYTDIKAAFDSRNYEEVYRLFQTAYTAHPTTGEQYKKLKEQGLN